MMIVGAKIDMLHAVTVVQHNIEVLFEVSGHSNILRKISEESATYQR